MLRCNYQSSLIHYDLLEDNLLWSFVLTVEKSWQETKNIFLLQDTAFYFCFFLSGLGQKGRYLFPKSYSCYLPSYNFPALSKITLNALHQ